MAFGVRNHTDKVPDLGHTVRYPGLSRNCRLKRALKQSRFMLIMCLKAMVEWIRRGQDPLRNTFGKGERRTSCRDLEAGAVAMPGKCRMTHGIVASALGFGRPPGATAVRGQVVGTPARSSRPVRIGCGRGIRSGRAGRTRAARLVRHVRHPRGAFAPDRQRFGMGRRQPGARPRMSLAATGTAASPACESAHRLRPRRFHPLDRDRQPVAAPGSPGRRSSSRGRRTGAAGSSPTGW